MQRRSVQQQLLLLLVPLLQPLITSVVHVCLS
ncbi:hypothetical protein LMJF_05_0320 [Leishmania major strain Friedlin]|uniref:Uncharacterized protein n=1 Tax=Leishmania major TaxID=5664 RepID=Q4QJH0_LEIMA|nr:hypothetical protein LMJF_05_0320 [Leishmania major strain Friedlin]CAG9568211.1 monothiol_glutaredoxin_-_putative [Leishmania major strain Friedlin]CAJ01952.1 hypothetical protein LMJF_05_0320 [Leishmania major strain Friedlin]|eukprot:XP_001687509.1 hypothetical protein LMJF_05_0320 [Leishmania major strain Friedlin]